MKKSNTRPSKIRTLLKDAVAEIETIFSSRPKDVAGAIKMDHDGLRNFLGLLKDTDQKIGDRRRAYELFSELLKSHTVSEEKAVYDPMKDLAGREMHIKVAEGFVEHHLAKDLMKRIEKTSDPIQWSAHANVLSEIVEHHLREEERDLLPLIRKAASQEKARDMLNRYLSLRAGTQKKRISANSGVLKKL